MLSLGRSASRRLLQQSTPGMCGSSGPLQQWAGFAKKARGEEGGGDSRTTRLLRALEPRQVEEVQLSPDDLAEAERRVKEYSRQKMRAHREWQKDITTKIQLRDAALAALPPELRAAALVPDLEPFPANRQMWTDTPPIEGFGEAVAKQQAAGRKSIGTKQRR